SQASPLAEQMPCPYCVIFRAVQWKAGRAAIRPATTLVLPTLRECPPMTRMGMGKQFSGRTGFVIPSEARDLQFAARCRSLALLGMTIHKLCLTLRAQELAQLLIDFYCFLRRLIDQFDPAA